MFEWLSAKLHNFSLKGKLLREQGKSLFSTVEALSWEAENLGLCSCINQLAWSNPPGITAPPAKCGCRLMIFKVPSSSKIL